jgi:hypothetical protein
MYPAFSQDTIVYKFERNQRINNIHNFENSIQSLEKGFIKYSPKPTEKVIKQGSHNVLMYERPTDTFSPKLNVWYFYDKDSIVYGVNYNWSFNNPIFPQDTSKHNEVVEDQLHRRQEYIDKYTQVRGVLEHYLGQYNNTKIYADSEKKYIEVTTWENDWVKTSLEIHFDPVIIKLPGTNFDIGGEMPYIVIKTFTK